MSIKEALTSDNVPKIGKKRAQFEALRKECERRAQSNEFEDIMKTFRLRVRLMELFRTMPPKDLLPLIGTNWLP